MLTNKRAFILGLVFFSLLPPTVIAATAANPIVFYVSANGSDDNSGTLPKPFRTLQHARDAIRALKHPLDRPVEILIRGGTYALTSTLTFGSEDSGTPESPITYKAYPGETPIIRGSQELTKFVPYSGDIYKMDLEGDIVKGIKVSQVFMNGERLVLARMPKSDVGNPHGGKFLYVAQDTPKDKKHFTFKAGDIDVSKWKNEGMDTIEVVIFPSYNFWNNTIRIHSVDPAKHLVELVQDASYTITPGDRYYVQNIFEELNAANEWYRDEKTNTLYINHPGGIDKPVTVPVVNTLLKVSNAHYLTFREISFEEFEGDGVVTDNADHVEIANCRVRNGSGNGIALFDGDSVTVKGTEVSEVGLHGITGQNSLRYFQHLISSHYLIDGNTIYHNGIIFKGSIGINLSTVGAVVSHNEIHDTPRTGITYEGNDNIIEYNHIHDVSQEVQDSGAIHPDHRSWIKRGNIIRYNQIEDTGGYGRNEKGEWVSPFFSFGIYLDDYTSGTHVYGNTIKRAYKGGIIVHSGRDNNIEHNTIIGTTHDAQAAQVIFINDGWNSPFIAKMWDELQHLETNGYDKALYYQKYPELNDIKEVKGPADQADIPAHNKFTNNTIYYTDANTLLYDARRLGSHTEINNNIIYPGAHAVRAHYEGTPAGYGSSYVNKDMSWQEWNNLGFDKDSRIISDKP